MNARHRFIALSLLVSAPFLMPSSAQAASFSTLILTPLTIEGLTGDNRGNLYAPGRNAGVDTPCPVWRVNIANPTLVLVGTIPAPAGGQCSPSGLAFDRAGRLYVSATDRIFALRPATPRRRSLPCSLPACLAPTGWPSIVTEISGQETEQPARAGCGRSAPPELSARCFVCSQWRTTWSRAA